MSQSIVSFKGISKSFSSKAGLVIAIENVTFEVAVGEFVVLVGPSGCGKSTLLNLAAGMIPPSSGAVQYRGEDVTGLNLRTGFMTQEDHLLPWRDVVGNIATPLEIRGDDPAGISDRVDRLIQLVGLTGFEKSYPSQLSGGMRKRTALARLLAYDPETLLLDEPFAALDAQLRLSMQTELFRICRSLNKTILFVTHDLDEAVALADRILVFTKRPGTIQRVVSSPLEKNRDIPHLRHDPAYSRATAALWDLVLAEVC